jgi:lysophospholipase L1-like esterase
MRSRLILVVLLFGSVALGVGLAELGLRLAHYGEANQTHVKFTEYDPLLGWRHTPNSSGELSNDEYHTTVKYNSTGLRGLDRPYTKPQNVFRIVVLGDSFVDGYTVQEQDRLTEALESSLGPTFEVINLGVPGYSTDQELLLLEQAGWKYEPDLVVLAFYYNDVWGNGSSYFANNASTQKPLFITDAAGNLRLTNVPVPHPARTLQDRFKVYALTQRAIKRNPLLFSLAVKMGVVHGKLPDDIHPAPSGAMGGSQEFRVYQKTETPELKREWTITQAILRKMKRETEQRGVRFLIFYVPTRIELSPEEWSSERLPLDYDPDEVTKRLVGICKVEGIEYIEPSDRFKAAAKQAPLYYHRDPHWNAAGHHLAGEILAEYVRSNWQKTVQ